MNQQTLKVIPGDIIAQQDGPIWRIVKVLEVDPFPDGTLTAHCLTYNDSTTQPTAASVCALGIRVWHAPILTSSFGTGWDRISNQPVSKAELVGFTEYLKLTDFPRYISVTGQDANEIVRKANEHYSRASHLAERGQRSEAIEEYTRAIDRFPVFYEAIDNRGFTYMELGKYKDALVDFESSLRVNPNGMAAFFSRGECLLRLGQFGQAEAIFQQGLTRFPEQRTTFERFLQLARSKRAAG